jgi:hypothetical protein
MSWLTKRWNKSQKSYVSLSSLSVLSVLWWELCFYLNACKKEEPQKISEIRCLRKNRFLHRVWVLIFTSWTMIPDWPWPSTFDWLIHSFIKQVYIIFDWKTVYSAAPLTSLWNFWATILFILETDRLDCFSFALCSLFCVICACNMRNVGFFIFWVIKNCLVFYPFSKLHQCACLYREYAWVVHVWANIK